MIYKKGASKKILLSCFLGIALMIITGCASSIRYTRDIKSKRSYIKTQPSENTSTV